MNRVLCTIMCAGTLVISAQTPPTGGRGAAPNAPAIPNLSLRPTGSSLGTIRVGAADNNIWFGWHVAVPAADFKQLDPNNPADREKVAEHLKTYKPSGLSGQELEGINDAFKNAPSPDSTGRIRSLHLKDWSPDPTK